MISYNGPKLEVRENGLKTVNGGSIYGANGVNGTDALACCVTWFI